MKKTLRNQWTLDDAASEYGIDRWGDQYFSISDTGSVVVRPDGPAGHPIDLKSLVDRLKDRGLQLPILIRFNGILKNRIDRIEACFGKAINEYGYENQYRCVFPIKVNQQREVVQKIIAESGPRGFGIEAGSKPELLAAIAMSDSSVPIVCNGFKDEEFIRLAMMAQRMGRTVFPVIEKASELNLVLAVASEIGVRPRIGMRVKLATRGTGRWQASGGYRSKFGLTVAEVLASLDQLIEMGLEDCFQMLHFHVGSQIGDIRQLKSAILEAARIYVDLKRRGAAMGHLDVGGGLGVDYDGSQSDTPSSINYSMQEYANDVVYHIQSVCDDAGVVHPEIMTESGRAIAAQHSVLVMETLGVTSQTILSPNESSQTFAPESGGTIIGDTDSPPSHYEQPVQDLWHSHRELNESNVMETFHDAQSSLDLCMNLFSGGYLSLEQRVAAENLYFSICGRVREMKLGDDHVPNELASLNRLLSDIYFVNFSLFQSLPDAWAIDHLFPIMPIHRLDQRPTCHAVLGDITCDSDGKVDSFVCGHGTQKTLRLHPFDENEPYLLGVFMVGAYQEILGDLHNLFGDTHAVHVDCEGESVKVRSIVKGDTVSEVLSYVQYNDRDLIERIQESVEEAIGNQLINHSQAGQTVAAFERALSGYTYLKPLVTPKRSAIGPLPAGSNSPADNQSVAESNVGSTTDQTIRLDSPSDETRISRLAPSDQHVVSPREDV